MIKSDINFYRCKYTVHFELPESIEEAIDNLKKITPILKKINKSKIIVLKLEKSNKDYLDKFISYINDLDDGLICGISEKNENTYKPIKNISIRYPNGNPEKIIKKMNTDYNKICKVYSKSWCTVAMDTLKVDSSGKVFSSTCKHRQTEIESIDLYDPKNAPIICDYDKSKCENDEISLTKYENVFYERKLDNNNNFAVKWRLFENCNYHCPYCIQAERSKNKKIDILKIFETAENISKLINNNFKTNKISLTLIGGEPTILNIVDMTNLLHKVNEYKKFNYFHFTTNFFRGANYFNTIYDNIDCGMKIVCSFHEDQTDLDKFLNEIYLLNKEIKVIIEHVMTKDNFQKSIELLEEIKKRNTLTKRKIKVQFDIERDNVGIKDQTVMSNFLSMYDNQKYHNLFDESIITKYKRNLPKESINENFCGCKCESKTLVVDYDGKLYKRTCKQKQCIGNISNIDNIQFDNETVVYCPNTVCNFCEFIKIYKGTINEK